MNTFSRIAGWLLVLALVSTAAVGGGCDKYRRTSVWTYGTAGAPAAVVLPPAPSAAPVQPGPPAACADGSPPAYEPAPAPPEDPQTAAPAALAPPPAPPDVEVLARGPMHEAFAEPVVANAAPGLMVNRAPPPLVQEMPPAERPFGAIWIPGYWAWDDDQGDFLWVSGLWRIAPPGCRWVPGYWAPVSGGWQWVPGFWLSETVQQVEYLPAPPPSLEVGPVGLPPSPDYIWAAGCWSRRGQQYAWQTGFWQPARPDRVYVPAHYIWTPRGCVFVAGYWDYGMPGRGILFAPVRFGRPLYVQPGYMFTPAVVIQTPYLTIALFARPQYHHYYFGDYFEVEYAGLGIMPWYESRTRHDWYDPIYLHTAWRHRQEDRWEDRERDRYEHLRLDRDARPPRTLAQQIQVQQTVALAPDRPAESRPVMLAAPLSEVVARKASQTRFEKLDDARRQTLQGYAQQLRTYRDQRMAVEAGPAIARSRVEPTAPVIPPRDPRSVLAPARQPVELRKPEPPVDVKRLDRPGLPPEQTRTPDRPAPLSPDVRRPEPPAGPPVEIERPEPGAPSTANRRDGSRPSAETRTPGPVVRPPVEVRRPEPPSPPETRKPQPSQVTPPTQVRPPTPVRPPVMVPAEPKTPVRPASPPAEARAPQPLTSPPEVRRPQPVPVSPAEVRRPQPVVPPQEARRPAAPVTAAPEVKRPGPSAPPPAEARRPQPPTQPPKVERPPTPARDLPTRAVPAPRPPTPAPPAQVRPVEQPRPPRVDAPRPTPTPPLTTRRVEPAPPKDDGKDREKGRG
jgi:hypothetical protein